MRRFRSWLTLASLLLAAPLLPSGPSSPAVFAAADAASVQRALDDDAGWSPHASKDGIQVYSKALPAIELTAFKGVGLLEVDGARLFALISDLAAHTGVTGTLHESVVLSSRGGVTDYYQVMKSPGPFLSPRYWFNRSVNTENVGGVAGRSKRVWSTLDATLYPKARQDVATRYPDAVAITLTHGSWEIAPDSPGRFWLIYRAVSHAGGNIPTSVAAAASSQSLPNNMLSFVRAVGGKAVTP